MKHCKLLSLLSAAVLGCSATVIPLAAELPANVIVAEAATEYTYGDFKYTVSGSYATITKYTANAYSVSIPSTIPHQGSNKTVRYIGANAFYRKAMRTLSIPNTIQVIGDSAFYDCEYLTELSIPSSVTTIEDYAFYLCLGLTDLVLPSNVVSIGEGAFSYCRNIQNVRIDGRAAIYSYAFSRCYALKNVTMSYYTTRGDNGDPNTPNAVNVFKDCTSLSKINGANALATQQGDTFPSINSNSNVRNVIKKFFLRSENVWFINNYCANLCSAVMLTETDDWSDIVKTRQMHDWVIRNCDDWLPGNAYGEPKRANDPENTTVSGVLLGYGLYGKCYASSQGYARLYQRMLYQVGIEAYCMTKNDLWWNIAKVNGNYYQTSVEKDNYNHDHSANQNIFETNYTYYMKKGSEMVSLLGSNYANGYNFQDAQYVYGGHYNINAPSQCNTHFNDSNKDGIMDGDWDFNGTIQYHDTEIRNLFGLGTGINPVTNDHMKYFLYNLHTAGITPTQFLGH